jgi:hypothetical protein
MPWLVIGSRLLFVALAVVLTQMSSVVSNRLWSSALPIMPAETPPRHESCACD